MIRLLRRRLFLSSLSALALGIFSRAASASNLPAQLRKLLADFRACPGLEAEFEEEKNIVLLAAPLLSSGTIYFHPPHSMARVMKKPERSHLVVSKNKIVVKEGNVRKEVDLSDKPALSGLVQSLLHVLSGDEKKLVSDFDVHFSEEGAGGYRLQLIPKDPDLRRLVKSLHFSGKGLALTELRVKEASGDETVTRFSKVNAKRRFSKEEIRKIFEI